MNCRKGENGEQCIKLAICETAQNNEKSEDANTFVRELMRVIFR